MHVIVTAHFRARRPDIVLGKKLVTPGEIFRARLTDDDMPTFLSDAERIVGHDLVDIESVQEVREPWEQPA